MYVKMYEQIFNSSIMEEAIEIRYIWMCLLVLADKEGFIDMTIPAIARRINIDAQSVKNAIEIFSQPDETSRTPTSDGRRLEKIRDSFGWKIVNYQHYRDLRDEDARREQNRLAKQRERQKKSASVSASQHGSARVSTGQHESAHTDTDTNTDTNTDTKEKGILSSEQKTVHSTLRVGFDMPPDVSLENVGKSNTVENSTRMEHSEGGNGRVAKEDLPIVVDSLGSSADCGGADHSLDCIPPDGNDLTIDYSEDGTGGDKQLSEHSAKTNATTTKKNTKQDFVLPDWVPKQEWDDFVEMRKKIKRPMTEAAMKLAVNTLEKLRREGHDVTAVINQSILNSWQGLFPLKENYKNKQFGGFYGKRTSEHVGINEKDYTEGF